MTPNKSKNVLPADNVSILPQSSIETKTTEEKFSTNVEKKKYAYIDHTEQTTKALKLRLRARTDQRDPMRDVVKSE